MLEAAETRDWGYALILLVALSALFLFLRLLGRAFVATEFEILIIYAPTAICLLVYLARSLGLHSK